VGPFTMTFYNDAVEITADEGCRATDAEGRVQPP
jgi:hypothetical protein